MVIYMGFLTMKHRDQRTNAKWKNGGSKPTIMVHNGDIMEISWENMEA